MTGIEDSPWSKHPKPELQQSEMSEQQPDFRQQRWNSLKKNPVFNRFWSDLGMARDHGFSQVEQEVLLCCKWKCDQACINQDQMVMDQYL